MLAIEQPQGGCGIEMTGVRLAELADDEVRGITAALGEHGVVFFRDQTLSIDQHLALAARFGAIDINRFFRAVPGYPAVAEVRKEPDQRNNIGGGWHTDHSYDVVPAMGSILVARELPEAGGDTLFSNMYAAFEGLSEGLKATLLSLRAVHSSRHVFGAAGAYRSTDQSDTFGNADAVNDAVHPVVITHPISGRRALYVNPAFTLRFEGWSAEESKPLLDYLYRQAARPEYTCRFRWAPGSVAFWDNRATWHYALNDYHGERRLMHRITLQGVPLE
jgi:taurine dioxygenase